MAKKSKKASRKRHTPPQRRRVYIFPYVVMAILIIGIPLGIFHFYKTNVNRNIKELREAIATYDRSYLEENTDRLPIILDVLKKSYSEDGKRQDEFYKNNFENLEIQVTNEENVRGGKEVTVSVSNVNYIDVYEKLPENDNEDLLHADYMAALSNPSAEKNTREAKLTLERKFNGYEIFESRDFINAILGGALDYSDGDVEMLDPLEENN